jgi:hypothetical protein
MICALVAKSSRGDSGQWQATCPQRSRLTHLFDCYRRLACILKKVRRYQRCRREKEDGLFGVGRVEGSVFVPQVKVSKWRQNLV